MSLHNPKISWSPVCSTMMIFKHTLLLVYPILLNFASVQFIFVKSLDIETQKETLKALELVGNLGNKSNYTYSKSQSDQIKRALREKVNEVCKKFDISNKNKNHFELE